MLRDGLGETNEKGKVFAYLCPFNEMDTDDTISSHRPMKKTT